MNKFDRGVGVSLILVGLMMYVNISSVNFPEFKNDPGPIFLPKVVIIGMVICGLGLLFWPKSRMEKTHEKNTQENTNNLRMFGLFVTLISYVLIFKMVGFVISTILFLSFSIWFLSKTKNIKTFYLSIFTSLIVTGTIYLVFVKALKIVLPIGIF